MNVTEDDLRRLASALATAVTVIGVIFIAVSAVLFVLGERKLSLLWAMFALICCACGAVQFVVEARHRARYKKGEW